MDNFKRQVGKKIKARRKEVGFDTQASLAKAMHVDQSRVARWESGANLPDTSLRAELCLALKIDDDYLFEGKQIDDGPTLDDAISILLLLKTATPSQIERVRSYLSGSVLTEAREKLAASQKKSHKS